MKNVLIVGCGQLGSRHLQSFKLLDFEITIHLVDPSHEALTTSLTRYQEGAGEKIHNINVYTKLEDIPREYVYDLAIFSNSSNTRFESLRDFTKCNNATYIILEKILFNKLDEYDRVLDLFSEKSTEIYVNCPMRTIDLYKSIGKLIEKREGPIQYVVRGKNFGLMTNLIHHLDLMYHYTGSSIKSCDFKGLNENLIKSKRMGFYEMTGNIAIDFLDNSSLIIEENNSGKKYDVNIKVICENLKININEQDRIVTFFDGNSVMKRMSFEIPFQSILTAEYFKDIFTKGTCDLPSLSESIEVHKGYLIPLMKYIRERNDQVKELIPFT